MANLNIYTMIAQIQQMQLCQNKVLCNILKAVDSIDSESISTILTNTNELVEWIQPQTVEPIDCPACSEDDVTSTADE